MKTVIVSEKDDQARKTANALGHFDKIGQVYVLSQTDLLEGEVHVVAADGHLFEYTAPENNWKLENLPLVDVSFKMQLKKAEKGRRKNFGGDPEKCFATIYQEVQAADRVIIGTDSDREGERIAYSILSRIPGGKKKIWKRLWLNSMTKKAIRQAFQNLREPEETYNYFLEAEARAQSDWLVGMNLSPLVTLELQQAGQVPWGKGQAFSVGRCQTPVVRVICENDLAIRNFSPRLYWKLQLEDKNNGQVFFCKEKYFDSEEAFEATRSLSSNSLVSSVERRKVQQQAPQLFDLASLQDYASKRWKIEAKQTESLLESLYLKGYVTYPRTRTRYITDYEFDYLKMLVQAYQEVLSSTFELVHLEARKTYVDASKIRNDSHHAIIPTETIPDFFSLQPEERLIYEAVTRRTLLMFAADCVYETSTVRLKNQDLEFVAKGRRMVDLGWAAVANLSVRKDIELPIYQIDSLVPSSISVQEGVTKPPKRITESMLLSEIFPRYGIGTPATQGTIIETIQARGYVTKDKKTGQFLPTNKAYLLINYLYDNEFADPETTGGWESFLAQIGEGAINPREFVDGIKEKLTLQISQAKERND